MKSFYLNRNFQAQGGLQEAGATWHACQSFAKHRGERPSCVCITQVSSLPSSSCPSVEALSVHPMVSGAAEQPCVVSTAKPGPEPIPHGTELSRNIFSVFPSFFPTIAFRMRGICKRNINSESCPKPRWSSNNFFCGFSSLTVQVYDLAAVSKHIGSLGGGAILRCFTSKG